MRSKTWFRRTVAVLERFRAAAGVSTDWLAAIGAAAGDAGGAASSDAGAATARCSVTRRGGADCASAATGEGSEARVDPGRSPAGVGIVGPAAAAERAARLADLLPGAVPTGAESLAAARAGAVGLAAPAVTRGRAVRPWSGRPSGLSVGPAAAAAVSGSLPLSATATAACGPARDNPIANAAAPTLAKRYLPTARTVLELLVGWRPYKHLTFVDSTERALNCRLGVGGTGTDVGRYCGDRHRRRRAGVRR